MAYTINFSDSGKSPISVTNNSIDTSTNIGLVGQGQQGFGEVTAENFLHLLENFAAGTAPSKPVEGQLWYDTPNRRLMYFDDTVARGGNWVQVSSMRVQTNAPTNVGERDGHLWLDSDNGELSIYYNGSWRSITNFGFDTKVVARERFDTSNNLHRTLEFVVNGAIVSIMSSDSVSWAPNATGANAEYLEDGTTLLNTQFPMIEQGENYNTSGDFFLNGTALRATYADLAERYHADAPYKYGTIVKLGGEHEITQTTEEFDADVFGVISENPAYGMNSRVGDQSTHPFVAFSGRLPCRVIGPVNKGQRLVSSNVPGYAMADTGGAGWQYIIGRALEDKVNNEPGVIEVVVGAK